MARTCTYLNFSRNTEEAFNFYQSVSGGEFSGGGVARFSDVPKIERVAELQEMFWGAYYGTCTDKFGVRWMFNCISKV